MKTRGAKQVKKWLAKNRVAQPEQPAAPNQAAMAAAGRSKINPRLRFGNLKNLIGVKPKPTGAALQGLGNSLPSQANQPAPAQPPQSPSVPFKESIVQQPEPTQSEPMQPETPATPTPSAPTEPRQLGAALQGLGNLAQNARMSPMPSEPPIAINTAKQLAGQAAMAALEAKNATAPQAPGNPPQPLQTSQPAPARPIAPKGMAIGPAQQMQQNKAQMYQTEPGPAKSQAELEEEKKKQMGQV
jgi:hypothetical protein